MMRHPLGSEMIEGMQLAALDTPVDYFLFRAPRWVQKVAEPLLPKDSGYFVAQELEPRYRRAVEREIALTQGID